MPSLLHEALVDLLRRRPELVVELIAAWLPFSPTELHLRVEPTEFPQLIAPARAADLVLVLRDESNAARLGIVVEVQLRFDPDKAFTAAVLCDRPSRGARVTLSRGLAALAHADDARAVASGLVASAELPEGHGSVLYDMILGVIDPSVRVARAPCAGAATEGSGDGRMG